MVTKSGEEIVSHEDNKLEYEESGNRRKNLMIKEALRKADAHVVIL